MTLVSVVIPTYQRPESLARAIASVEAQTHPNVELVVVEDTTPRDAYPADRHSFWCVKGVPPRNTGLDRAAGEWVLPLDDDDELEADAIASLLAAALENDWEVVYGRSLIDGGGVLGSWPPRASGFVNGAVMWRASLGYRYSFECAPEPADWDLWHRMLTDGRRWGFVPQIVHRYHPADRVPVADPA